MTAKQIAEIRARADAATPGQWSLTDDDHYLRPDVWRGKAGEGTWPAIASFLPFGSPGDSWYEESLEQQQNARFCAHARTDVPALCDHIDVLEAENSRLRIALDDVITDLEERSNWKQGPDNGVVDIGNGVYYRAKKALGVIVS